MLGIRGLPRHRPGLQIYFLPHPYGVAIPRYTREENATNPSPAVAGHVDLMGYQPQGIRQDYLSVHDFPSRCDLFGIYDEWRSGRQMYVAVQGDCPLSVTFNL